MNISELTHQNFSLLSSEFAWLSR